MLLPTLPGRSDVSYGADAAKALKKVRAEIEELRR